MKPETSAPSVDRQTMPSSPADRTEAHAKRDPLVGLAVISSEGSKLGNVRSVRTGPDGMATAILLKTGGFLGFGGRIVAIPANKFTRNGDSVHVGMTAEEVSQLPEAKEQS